MSQAKKTVTEIWFGAVKDGQLWPDTVRFAPENAQSAARTNGLKDAKIVEVTVSYQV